MAVTNKHFSAQQFNQLVTAFLAAEEEGDKFKFSHQLADLLAIISGISADDSMSRRDDVVTDSGVAIMPVQAAKCLKEAVRSHKFLHGVRSAINEQLEQKNTINLLYAGSGPWGSIVIPLLHLYQAEQIQITLLDIHQQNIDAIRQLIDSLGLASYFTQISLADATKWQPEVADCRFDIIVSETMNTMLKREPQVAIFAHLQQFLQCDGVLIPERVTIAASACAAVQKQIPPIKLKDMFVLDKDCAQKIYQQNLVRFDGEFYLPKSLGYIAHLQFDTVIQVYKEIVLSNNQCSLNIPHHLYSVSPAPNTAIKYSYQISAHPDWQFDYKSLCHEVEIAHPSELNNQGLMHIRRFWDKYRRLQMSGYNNQDYSNELELDIKLMQLLGINVQESISFVSSEVPEFDDFQTWIENKQQPVTASKIKEFNDVVDRYQF